MFNYGETETAHSTSWVFEHESENGSVVFRRVLSFCNWSHAKLLVSALFFPLSIQLLSFTRPAKY